MAIAPPTSPRARELLGAAPRVAEPEEEKRRCAGRAARAALPLSTLRRADDRHRGLRAWLRAETSANACSRADQDRHVMTDARIARCKATRLGRRSSARQRSRSPCCASSLSHGNRRATPATHILLVQLSPIILSAVGPAPCCPPNPPSPPSPQRLNPHRARCTAGAPPPATSCLGASPTPTGSACGEPNISASEKPAHEPTHALQQIEPYSITSSAWPSKDGATVRPSALAVFRLITNSNLVGACTGRFAGLSPLRRRSTYEAARGYCSFALIP